MNKDKNFEIKYPHYCIEITLKNDDILMFSFLNSQKYGACLLVEDTPYMECSTPDEVIANTKEEERLKELVILEEGISTVDVNEQRKNLPIKIKEINIYDNDRNNGFTLAGNLVKYSVDMATKYGLNEKYAYDYVKPNIRQKKYK